MKDAPALVLAPTGNNADEAGVAKPGVAPPSPRADRNGVAMTVLGVAIAKACGKVPLKSVWVNGVFIPPFNGVSVCVSAMTF